MRDLLLQVARSTVVQVARECGRDEQYAFLRQQLDPQSPLEVEFLDFLYRTGRRLPDRMQYRPEPGVCAEADFFYDSPGRGVCVFCDGPTHDDPVRGEQDRTWRGVLEDMGYIVVVVRYDRDIGDQVRGYVDVFGAGTQGGG